MSLARMSFMQKAVMAVAPLALVFTAGAASAQSLQPGKCYPRAEADALLAKDGQEAIMVGNRITDTNPANIFYRNEKGTLGYNLEGDKSLGTPSTNLCVAGIIKDIVMHSPDNEAIPSGLVIKPANGIDVNRAYASGSRIVFVGRTFSKAADGSEKLGQRIVVSVTPSDRGSDVWGVDSRGIPDGAFSMRNFALLPAANKFIPAPVAVAPTTPSTVAVVGTLKPSNP